MLNFEKTKGLSDFSFWFRFDRLVDLKNERGKKFEEKLEKSRKIPTFFRSFWELIWCLRISSFKRWFSLESCSYWNLKLKICCCSWLISFEWLLFDVKWSWSCRFSLARKRKEEKSKDRPSFDCFYHFWELSRIVHSSTWDYIIHSFVDRVKAKIDRVPSWRWSFVVLVVELFSSIEQTNSS